MSLIAAIAVSGGADSMALLHLTHAEYPGHVVALTVDHGLRAESAEEARRVARWCESLGVAHQTLRVQLNSPSQQAARTARYRALADYCKQHNIPALLTAHHRDDQVETLFMRLSRGSFIDGLACMAPVSETYGVCLIRPLLDIPKSSLKAYLQHHNHPWIEDPSNQNPRYLRNRIRALIADEALHTRAHHLIQRFAAIRTLLDAKVEAALAACVAWRDDRTATLALAPFQALPPEISLRMLTQLTRRLSQKDHPPRSEKIARLHAALREPSTQKSLTLAGLRFVFCADKKYVLIHLPA